MNLPLFIARRYLFSKKSHNAINVISVISVCGIAIATAAIIIVLSGFNGFGGIVENMFNAFDPDLKITAKTGKVFDYHTPQFDEALRTDGIQMIAETLEENALYKFENQQVPVLLKGISPEFKLMTDMDKLMVDGQFKLTEEGINYTSLGAGLAITLGARAGFVNPIDIYAPKRDVKVNLANPSAAFTHQTVQIGGVFSLNQADIDNQVAIIPISLARRLFRYKTEVSSLSIKLEPRVSVKKVKREMEKILGDNFAVENRFEQQIESYRMLQIEKWVSFLILSLILLIAIFNIVGSLTMLIVEKTKDIKSLKNMGADNRLVSTVFLYEGWLIAFLGIVSGLMIGLIVCLLQQHFGLLRLSSTPGAYVVEAYPIIVQFWDVVVVFATVSAISLLAVYYTIHNLKRRLNSAGE